MIARRGFFARVAAFFGMATVGNRIGLTNPNKESADFQTVVADKSSTLPLTGRFGPMGPDEVRVLFEWTDDLDGECGLRVLVEYRGQLRGIVLDRRVFAEKQPIYGLLFRPHGLEFLPKDDGHYASYESPIINDYKRRKGWPVD